MASSDIQSCTRSSNPSGDNKLTVYFDGSCPLCEAEIDFYASRNGGNALRLVDVSLDGTETGPGLDREDAMRRFHVRRPDGSLLSGATAFAAIWQTLPGWRVAGRVARLWPVSLLFEIMYRLFLPLRPAFSRLARRMMP